MKDISVFLFTLFAFAASMAISYWGGRHDEALNLKNEHCYDAGTFMLCTKEKP